MILRSRPRRTAHLLVGGLSVALAALAAPAIATPPEPSTPPTTQSVTKKLDALGHVTERLAEQYNKARIDVAKAENTASLAQQRVRTVGVQYLQAQTAFARQAQAEYQASSLGSAGALLASDSGAEYLQRLDTLGMIATHDSDVLDRLKTMRTTARAARADAARALGHARTARRTVDERRAEAADRTKKLKGLLATLTAREQQTYAQRGSASPGQLTTLRSTPAGNAAAQRAVDFALKQVGKPYVFGAAGPDAYDCSGLTARAWEEGGVTIPHLAADQINYGTRVGADQLQPGDLVFLYDPIGHVSMYIGGGMLVSAPQPGENVKIVPFAHFRADFTGATRLA